MPDSPERPHSRSHQPLRATLFAIHKFPAGCYLFIYLFIQVCSSATVSNPSSSCARFPHVTVKFYLEPLFKPDLHGIKVNQHGPNISKVIVSIEVIVWTHTHTPDRLLYPHH